MLEKLPESWATDLPIRSSQEMVEKINQIIDQQNKLVEALAEFTKSK